MDWIDTVIRRSRAFPAAPNYEEDNSMQGYSVLRARVRNFLRDNPDVQQVTLKRPPPKEKRRVYKNANEECYGRMPESCPIVQGILNRMLPTDGSMSIRDGNGDEISIEDLRDRIFSEIHSQVTSRFRDALNEVCEQKHVLLVRVRDYHKRTNEWIEEAETAIPEPPTPRTRVRNNPEELEVEVDEEESEY
jgi:hypothetical protein